MNTERMEKLVSLMKIHGLKGVALNPGPSLRYLTGLEFHLMERPTVLLVSVSGMSTMILPELEKAKLQDDTPVFQAFTYGDDPAAWQAAFDRAVEKLGLTQGHVGVEAGRMRFLELAYLKNALPNIEFVDGGKVIDGLRIKKESGEIVKMRRAAKIAQSAILATLKLLKEGMTEKQIANELVVQLLRAGSDDQLPFSPIVSLGENTANPHAVPSDRALQKGDLLLIDWGASFEGYFSDITRTFTFGEVEQELLKIGVFVLRANQAGRKTGKPGLAAGAVDRAARLVITEAGYGDFFIHRTGHGLGMEAHETPYIFDENRTILETGMTFTIEPGIYLPGRGGVRIEDDVVVTETGLDSLTDLPRELLPLEKLIG
ncbi:MAG: Xaa-Pro peptidase family protein [Brevefilum sp.]|nr:Xaa-Pro peptidase family protein [Brevefilum sp.]